MPIPTPILFLLFVIPTANLMILAFLGLYIRQLNKEKKELENKADQITEKEKVVDSEFHQAVNETIGQERKIIEDATAQAKTILTEAKFVSDNSKQVIQDALQKMITEVRDQSSILTKDIMTKHQSSMRQISSDSLNDFQKLTKQFEIDYQKQLQDFRNSVLAGLQRDIEVYKDKKLKDAEQTVKTIVEQVSQKVLNKTISAEDHQSLIIESLEKSRKEGIFD